MKFSTVAGALSDRKAMVMSPAVVAMTATSAAAEAGAGVAGATVLDSLPQAERSSEKAAASAGRNLRMAGWMPGWSGVSRAKAPPVFPKLRRFGTNRLPCRRPGIRVSPRMRIFVNDEPREVNAGDETVGALMRASGLSSPEGVAVAVNDGVVPRPQWATRALNDGDRVLVIRATQGG